MGSSLPAAYLFSCQISIVHSKTVLFFSALKSIVIEPVLNLKFCLDQFFEFDICLFLWKFFCCPAQRHIYEQFFLTGNSCTRHHPTQADWLTHVESHSRIQSHNFEIKYFTSWNVQFRFVLHHARPILRFSHPPIFPSINLSQIFRFLRLYSSLFPFAKTNSNLPWTSKIW